MRDQIYKSGNSLLTLGGKLIGKKKSPMRAVQIGDQIWTSLNMNIDDGGDGINVAIVTYDGTNFFKEYFYTWAAAVRVAATVNGWHLPSLAEYDTLISYLGSSTAGKQLKDTVYWNGTDTVGFHALPAGQYVTSHTDFNTKVEYWTSDLPGTYRGYTKALLSNSNAMEQNNRSFNNGYSVRLIKDS